jgi:hypothetical protein
MRASAPRSLQRSTATQERFWFPPPPPIAAMVAEFPVLLAWIAIDHEESRDFVVVCDDGGRGCQGMAGGKGGDGDLRAWWDFAAGH